VGDVVLVVVVVVVVVVVCEEQGDDEGGIGRPSNPRATGSARVVASSITAPYLSSLYVFPPLFSLDVLTSRWGGGKSKWKMKKRICIFLFPPIWGPQKFQNKIS
jgi:hypothetical protein